VGVLIASKFVLPVAHMLSALPARLWRKKMLPATALVGLLGLLTACATYNGIAEFEAYQRAFNSTYEAGEAILDIVAEKERRIFLNAYPPSATNYEPDYASYYVDSADPPGTAAFRRALNSVRAYNDILYGLASGQTTDALSAKLNSLNTSLSSAANETTQLLKAGSLSKEDLAKTIGGLDARVKAGIELTQFALRYKSREAFRRFAVEFNPVVQDILVSLRDGTQVIFPVLTRDATASIKGVDEVKIAQYRRLLSDWVLGLEVTMVALNRISVAIRADATFDSSIAAFTKSAIDLQLTASATRKHLAALAAN
jgi:hypothetical protein